ncbi:hypothetical protein [Massilia soli]|uniref:Flagellar protein FliT n=1 Tax=Massilia soli TaxID=2792854 RepID=A0ABS7SRR9_9BURK|nr:hypothetical protein [Massilia soli]MBZ2208632.1 hypothetical protein [Massilia soli]
MDRRAAIDALRDALATSAAARDWERLCGAVANLAPQLQTMLADGPFDAAELRAVARLRASHALAAKVCDEQRMEVLARMTELQDNKAGWIAYALDHQHELSENPA